MLEKIELSGKIKLEDLNDKDIVNVSVGSIRKINKLIDVVNVLTTENNIHERQIDKLQMAVKELQKSKKKVKEKAYDTDTIIQTALICRIIEDILDSYMEFADIVQQNAKLPGVPEQYQRLTNTLCERRKKDWGPILEDIKERRKNYV